MSEDPDRLWERLAPKYQKYKGLCPMTPEEAEAAYDAAPSMPLPSRTIREMVERITRDAEVADEVDEPPAWQDSVEHGELAAMHREKGEDDPDTDEIEAELRKQMLDGEDEDGVSGGAKPPGEGG
jgi:hypothetical protein